MNTVKDYILANIPIYMHEMLWWSKTNSQGHKHPEVDYDSDDPVATTVRMQNLVDLGIKGVVVDWYGDGPNFDLINHSARIMAAVCAKVGLTFTVGIDHAAIEHRPNQAISPTQEFINLVKYAQTFSLCTQIDNNKQTIFEFGMELLTKPLDWKVILAAYPKVNFIHRNIGGFSTPGAGSYAWIDGGESYLNDYYSRAIPLSKTFLCFGSLFKGFDNRKIDPVTKIPLVPEVPVWGGLKVIPENNGQTFLNTVNITNSFIAKGLRLAGIVINTDNDWEEGTAVEKKINSGLIASFNGNMNCLDGFSIKLKPLFR